MLPANQVIRKLEPLLKSLGKPFRTNVVSKVPNGGEEKWFGFLNTSIFSQAHGQPRGDLNNILHITWMPDHQGETASIHWSPVDGELIDAQTLLRGGERVKLITEGTEYDGRIGTAEGPAGPENYVYVTDLVPVPGVECDPIRLLLALVRRHVHRQQQKGSSSRSKTP